MEAKQFLDWIEGDIYWRSMNVDKEWMIRRAYYEGKQNFKYDTRRQMIVLDTNDPLKFYINLTRMAVRAIRGAIIKDSPVWDVDNKPYGTFDEEAQKVVNFYMHDLYNRINLDKEVIDIVDSGIVYGIGYIQYGYDPSDDNGEGQLWVDSLNPFTVYLGGRGATCIKDADRITKVIRRSVAQVRANKNYKNADKVKADNKLSSSEAENQLLNAAGQNHSAPKDDKDGTVLLYETWYKKEDDGIWVATYLKSGELLRNEKSDYEKFPFVQYDVDKINGEVYGDGRVKDIIPLNKAINYIERKILKYNATMSSGKYVVNEGSNVETITNESGEIIKVSAGGDFRQLGLAPISSTPFNQLQNLMRYFQDVSGAQEAFMGRAPSGVVSGVAFEQLAANAFSNMSDLTKNLIITLEELGEELLKLGYRKMNSTKQFKAPNEEGVEEVYSVIGDTDMVPEKAFQLPADPQVVVRIASEASFTKPAKREQFIQLYQLGAVDRRTLLELFDVDANKVEARIIAQNNGQPITDDLTLDDMMAEDPESAIQDFIMKAQEKGLEIDPNLTPEDILAMINDPQLMDEQALANGIVMMSAGGQEVMV